MEDGFDSRFNGGEGTKVFVLEAEHEAASSYPFEPGNRVRGSEKEGAYSFTYVTAIFAPVPKQHQQLGTNCSNTKCRVSIADSFLVRVGA